MFDYVKLKEKVIVFERGVGSGNKRCICRGRRPWSAQEKGVVGRWTSPFELGKLLNVKF